MRFIGKSPAKLTTAIIIIAGFVFSLAANLPGHASYDSVIQLLEGRLGSYNNWHPPVMAWLLGLFDWISPGTALFVVFDAALAFASFGAILWAAPRVSWAAAAVMGAIVLTPQLLLYQGIVWKDVLFADAGLAGFASLTLAAAFWLRPRLRFGFIAASMALLVLTTLARQNGILMLLAGVAALAWIAAQQGGLAMAAKYTGAALAGTLIALWAANTALNARLHDNGGPAAQIRLLQEYDLLGALAVDPGFHFTEFELHDPVLDSAMREQGLPAYNPQRNDPLKLVPGLESAVENARPGLIARQWHDLVFHHPGLYLRVRAEIFRWVFLTPDLSACVPFIVGVDGPPDELKELGLSHRQDTRDLQLEDYADQFVGAPVFSHLFYAALAGAALFILLRRRRAADIAMAGLLGGALACAASMFVISIACDYRYLYMLDLSTMLAVFYLALDRFGFQK